MAFGTYIYKIRNLMNLKRYQNLYMHKQRSVAEHQWSVAKIAQGLAYWEMKKFGNEVDLADLLQRAIAHDDAELFMGDILSHTKRKTTAMHKAVRDVEKLVVKQDFIPMLPQSWRQPFEKYILYAKDDTIEGKIIAASDIIDTILECVEEIKLGNQENFREILQTVTENLIKIDLPSVRYFLQYALPDFDLDIKEYFGEKVYDYIQSLKEKQAS